MKAPYGECAKAKAELRTLAENRAKSDELEQKGVAEANRRNLADTLATLVRGKALVTFLAQEYLRDIAADVSARLGRLTGQRYALEVTEDGGFVIRDDFNGGARRSVGTLSGGEMFLICSVVENPASGQVSATCYLEVIPARDEGTGSRVVVRGT